MLSFLKKIFGAKAVEVTPVPYKVEKPAAEPAKVSEFPFPSTKPVKLANKPTGKKPAVKKSVANKPAAKKTKE